MSTESSIPERIVGWWADFKHGGPREDAGAFARLRRAEDAVDALIEPVVVDLVKRVGFRDENRICTVAELAALLAHVREDDSAPVARSLRGPKFDQPVMTPIRFQRLLQTEAGAERLTAFRRAVAQLGGRANVADLARAYLDLDHPKYGRRVRVRWLLEYADETAGAGARPEPMSNDHTEDAA